MGDLQVAYLPCGELSGQPQDEPEKKQLTKYDGKERADQGFIVYGAHQEQERRNAQRCQGVALDEPTVGAPEKQTKNEHAEEDSRGAEIAIEISHIGHAGPEELSVEVDIANLLGASRRWL